MESIAGLARRYIGAAGVILGAFGIWDTATTDTATGQTLAVIGGAFYLFDLGKSTVNKLKAWFGGDS